MKDHEDNGQSSRPNRFVSRRTFLRRASTMVLGASGASLLAACGATPEVGQVNSSGSSNASASSNAGATASTGTELAVSAAPVAGGATKIQLYTLVWQPAAVEAAKASVNSWNEANGDRINVEYIQGDWGKVRDYVTTSVGAGIVPEIIHGQSNWSIDWGHTGAVLDLDALIKGSDLATDLNPVALDAVTSPLNQAVYAVPFVWEVGMMYINGDRFEQAGLAIPEKGWTWEEFRAAAKKVTNPPEYFGLAANLGGAAEDIIAWMWQTGAEVMGEKNGTWSIDLEPAREALVLWHEMINKDKIVSEESFGGANIFEAFPIGTY